MSLVPGPKLKTPWAMPINGRFPEFKPFGVITGEGEYAFKYILGDDWAEMRWEELYNTLKQSGMPIKITDDYTAMWRWIDSEWEKSGSIIPGKRMVLIEKRIRDEE